MKSLIPALPALFLGLFTSANAAVTVTDLTETEYLNLVSANTTAWVARFQAGGISGQESNELYLSANTVVTGEHVWTYPEQIQVQYDGAGNLYAAAGLDMIAVQPIMSFNAILVAVRDQSTPFGDVSFKNGLYNTSDIPNVDVNEDIVYFVIILGEENPIFSLAGDLDLFGTDSVKGNIEFTGINIPEPSTFVFSCIALTASLFYRKGNC